MINLSFVPYSFWDFSSLYNWFIVTFIVYLTLFGFIYYICKFNNNMILIKNIFSVSFLFFVISFSIWYLKFYKYDDKYIDSKIMFLEDDFSEIKKDYDKVNNNLNLNFYQNQLNMFNQICQELKEKNNLDHQQIQRVNKILEEIKIIKNSLRIDIIENQKYLDDQKDKYQDLQKELNKKEDLINDIEQDIPKTTDQQERKKLIDRLNLIRNERDIICNDMVALEIEIEKINNENEYLVEVVQLVDNLQQYFKNRMDSLEEQDKIIIEKLDTLQEKRDRIEKKQNELQSKINKLEENEIEIQQQIKDLTIAFAAWDTYKTKTGWNADKIIDLMKDFADKAFEVASNKVGGATSTIVSAISSFINSTNQILNNANNKNISTEENNVNSINNMVSPETFQSLKEILEKELMHIRMVKSGYEKEFEKEEIRFRNQNILIKEIVDDKEIQDHANDRIMERIDNKKIKYFNQLCEFKKNIKILNDKKSELKIKIIKEKKYSLLSKIDDFLSEEQNIIEQTLQKQNVDIQKEYVMNQYNNMIQKRYNLNQ